MAQTEAGLRQPVVVVEETRPLPVYVPPGGTFRALWPLVLAWLPLIAMAIFNANVDNGKSFVAFGHEVHLHHIGGWWFLGALLTAAFATGAWIAKDMPSARRMARAGVILAVLAAGFSADYHDHHTTDVKAASAAECGKDTFFNKKEGVCRSLDTVVKEDAAKDDWKSKELRSGDAVVFKGAPVERSANSSFIDKHVGDGDGVLENPAEIRSWINADTSKSKAARTRLKAALSDHDYKRALKGEGFYPLQYMLPAQYIGTTYYVDGKAVTMNSPRQVQAKDIVWMYITEDGKVIRAAAIRADCSNPSLKKVIPVRPTTPKAPPISRPPCTNCKPPPVCTHNCRPVTTPPPARQPKCFDASGRPVYSGEFCGTPNSGPEQQDPQDNDPRVVSPRSGCGTNNCEDTIDRSQRENEGVPQTTPNPYGSNTGSREGDRNTPGTDNGTPGSTSGTPVPGNDAGSSHPAGDPGGW